MPQLVVGFNQMKFLKFMAAAIASVCMAGIANADLIYESSTLGQIGVTKNDVLGPGFTGVNLATFNFVGVRFELSREVRTSAIGGHFVGGYVENSFFGAIVRLSNADDFPDSLDLSTSDVIGTTTLAFPTRSKDVVGKIDVSLQPGWYALVFGSGLFGTSGRGFLLTHNGEIGAQSYINGQPDERWRIASIFSPAGHGRRFILRGSSIPEPCATLLLGTCGVATLLRLRTRKTTL